MNKNNNEERGNFVFFTLQTSDIEMQKKLEEADRTTESAINVIAFQNLKYQNIKSNYGQIKNDNNMLKNMNRMLYQKNQLLEKENAKLKNEKKKLSFIASVSTDQFSIFGAENQIKHSIEKENRPNCEISNDNKFIDKNS